MGPMSIVYAYGEPCWNNTMAVEFPYYCAGIRNLFHTDFHYVLLTSLLLPYVHNFLHAPHAKTYKAIKAHTPENLQDKMRTSLKISKTNQSSSPAATSKLSMPHCHSSRCPHLLSCPISSHWLPQWWQHWLIKAVSAKLFMLLLARTVHLWLSPGCVHHAASVPSTFILTINSVIACMPVSKCRFVHHQAVNTKTVAL